MIFDPLLVALATYQAEPDAFDRAVQIALAARRGTRRVFFVGNGGSAAIASHMATDWFKNGRFAAQCFNDGAQLTCLANDLGYERVFSEPLSRFAHAYDIVVAISSSGASPNILAAAQVAKDKWLTLITLSGFKPDNPLRSMGDLNFYVPSEKYGIVEVAHLAILHAILDRVIDES